MKRDDEIRRGLFFRYCDNPKCRCKFYPKFKYQRFCDKCKGEINFKRIEKLKFTLIKTRRLNNGFI